jgi:hypothetical protein
MLRNNKFFEQNGGATGLIQQPHTKPNTSLGTPIAKTQSSFENYEKVPQKNHPPGAESRRPDPRCKQRESE